MKTNYFQCKSKTCKKTFRNEESLQKHYEENHQDGESESIIGYRCKKCKKILSTKQSLKEHFYTHTKQKPYKCPEPGCDKYFRQSSQLSYHKRFHLEIKNYIQNDTNVRQSTGTNVSSSTASLQLFGLTDSQDFTELPKISIPQLGIHLPNIFSGFSS